jgi:hypothetical protein
LSLNLYEGVYICVKNTNIIIIIIIALAAANKVLKDQEAHKDLKVFKVCQDLKELKDLKVSKVILDHKVHKAQKEILVKTAIVSTFI